MLESVRYIRRLEAFSMSLSLLVPSLEETSLAREEAANNLGAAGMRLNIVVCGDKCRTLTNNNVDLRSAGGQRLDKAANACSTDERCAGEPRISLQPFR